MNKTLILIGEVVRPHGIRGALKIRPFSDNEVFASAKGVYIGREAKDTSYLEVRSVQHHKGSVLLGLEGIGGINEALGLVGCRIYLERDAFKKLPEGEYYRFEILGLKVSTVDGRDLGRVEEIIETGSNDVYVARDSFREYLIPAIDEVVKEIDVSGGKVIITPIAGLLEEE